MKRITPLLLVVVAGSAQAGPESLFNPLAMMNPMPTPMPGYGGMPFGGYGNPYGGGFGGGYGYGNPMGSLNTLSALSSLGMMVAPLAPTLLNPMGMGQFGYPAMQMAPNMMSYGHYGQYGGGPFGGNPYLQRSLPNPLMPPAFSPSIPTMPFTPSQGTLPLPFGSPSLPFMASPSPLPPAGLIPGLSPMAPSLPPSQANPWATAPVPPDAASQATPWTTAPAATAPAPAAQMPWNPVMMMAVPAPAPQPKPEAAPAKTVEQQQAPVPMPLDPAAFMQMFMKPMEAVVPPPAPAAK
jgi:hypothetical protein